MKKIISKDYKKISQLFIGITKKTQISIKLLKLKIYVKDKKENFIWLII